MDNLTKAYYSTVTEYESGWGSRANGYLLAESVEAFHFGKTNIEKGGRDCFSRIDSKPIEILLQENIFEKKGITYIFTDKLPKAFKLISTGE